MQKQRLIDRLKWYGPLEKFHAFVTAPAMLLYGNFHFSIRESVFLSYGLIVCILILYQGQHYWKLKLHRLQNKPIDQNKNIQFFRRWKKLNILLISIMPVVFLIQTALDGWKIIPDNVLFWSILANVFAILEYINYYHIQLMIDNSEDFHYVLRNKRLKIAGLSNDLRRGRF